MERKSSDYLDAAKEALGNPRMSDRELGERLGGFSQPSIGKARMGNMSDPLALAVAAVLPEVEPGELVWVARMEREKDQAVRSALQAYMGKVMAAMPSMAAAPSALGGVVALPSQAAPVHADQSGLCIM